MVRLPSGALKCRSNCKVDVDDACDKNRKQYASLEEFYDVEKNVLGSGGFGIVRKATLRAGSSVCAVKTIAKASRVAVATANQEAQILQGLVHPTICKLIDVYEDPLHIHLVLECVIGHELFEEISATRLMTESRAACIMHQVFEAMQYCHDRRSIIHRDLKPENIMLTDSQAHPFEPQVKIIDWGLAAVCHDTIETPIVGTAAYLSPEALSAGIYSSASDMWSLGAVLYALLTGGDIPLQFKPISSSNSPQAKLLHELGTSQAACDILHSLLKCQACDRLSAASATRHPWISASSVSQDRDESVFVCRVDGHTPYYELGCLLHTAFADMGAGQHATIDRIESGYGSAKSRDNVHDPMALLKLPGVAPRSVGFVVFDDLAVLEDTDQVVESSSGKAKHHRH